MTDIIAETVVPKHSSGQTLWIVAAVTFGVGLAASGYLNYVQFSRAQDEKVALTGQITDLRYQMKQDKNAPSPTATPTDTASPTPTPVPSATPAVLGAQSTRFEQLGVGVTTSDQLTDLVYTPGPVKGGVLVANLTTTRISDKYPSCRAGLSSLGQLVRRPRSTPKSQIPVASKLVKSFGDYDFYYNKATAVCAPNSTGQAEVAAARQALMDIVLPTLTKL